MHEAARRLGIRIPTLCFVKGLEPSSSCFMCAVQVEGKANGCHLPARCRWRTAWWSRPTAKTYAPLGKWLWNCSSPITPVIALRLAERDVPPASTSPDSLTRSPSATLAERWKSSSTSLHCQAHSGRICPRLCEQGCRRCDLDEGLAIAHLHRYPADLNRDSTEPYLPPRAKPSGKSVAIVGAGPAGLAAAFYLLQKGHACTLHDAQTHPGGMLRYGIPSYRLPKDALDAEIESIREFGCPLPDELRLGDRLHS